MTKPEIIAYLDTLERESIGLTQAIREVKHLVFESLDSDPEDMVE